MSSTVRDHLASHPPRLLDGLTTARADSALPLERFEVGHQLVCTCGSDAFRVLGVPVAMRQGQGGYVLRSVLRVWRELQGVASGEDAVAGRLSPPIRLDCTRCGQRTQLLEAEDDRGHAAPLEALRCRPCRRSTFAVTTVFAHRDLDLDAPARGVEHEHYDAWHVGVRCRACGTLGEPFSRVLRGEQERRIDRLYGRDASDGASPLQEEPR